MRAPSIKDYPVSLYWDSRAGYYVAEIPDIPTCAADGETPADAIAALESTFALMKEAYAEESIPMPLPKEVMKLEILERASQLLNLSQVAQLSGLSPQTIASKLKRRTPLKPAEARAISRALQSAGLQLAAS